MIKRFLFTFAIFVIIFLGGIYVIIAQHEVAHLVIYESYGIESTITFYHPFGESLATTTPTNLTLADKNCNEYCNLSHNINDIVGYHLLAFYVLFVAIIFTYYLYRNV